MNRRTVFAVILVAVYAAACVCALWSVLWATLLLAVASPVAAGFTPSQNAGGRPVRVMIGLVVDAIMAGIAIDLPIVGDVVDGAVLLVAAIAMFGKVKRFVSDVPAGLACVVLYVVLWTERRFLPHPSFAPGIHHGWWFYPVVVLASAATGAAVIAVLTALIGRLGGRDYPQAVFRTVGYPWYFVLFAVTFMVPDRRSKGRSRP